MLVSLASSYLEVSGLPGSGSVSFSRLGNFLAIISSNKTSGPFSFWEPHDVNVSLFDVVP